MHMTTTPQHTYIGTEDIKVNIVSLAGPVSPVDEQHDAIASVHYVICDKFAEGERERGGGGDKENVQSLTGFPGACDEPRSKTSRP